MLTTAGKRARGTQPITQQPPSVLVRQRDCPVHLNLGPNYGGCFSSLIDCGGDRLGTELNGGVKLCAAVDPPLCLPALTARSARILDCVDICRVPRTAERVAWRARLRDMI